MPSLEANQLLLAAADACDSKKAEDIRILALDPSESSLTDYFLICTGTNERQNAAIADEIDYRLKTEFGVYPNSVEGRRQGEWVLMDYVDFVVHIFLPEKREYYGLERLRKTATTVSVSDLNAEINAALAKTRAKNPTAAKKAAKKATKDDGPGTSGSASGKRPEPAKVVAKKAAKTAAKKAPTKAVKAVTPAKAISAAKTVAATKVPAKKAVKAAAVPAKKAAKKAVKIVAKKPAVKKSSK